MKILYKKFICVYSRINRKGGISLKKEIRTVCYDEELKLEAYHFEGIVQPFPNHFHDYYVIGFIENGMRCLSCKNQKYEIRKGNILLFNPNDNHSCIQRDESFFDYRGLNIKKEIMMNFTEEITGKKYLHVFSENVIFNEELNSCLRSLHQMIMNGSKEFEKEELLLFLISALVGQYGQPFEKTIPGCAKEIEKTCLFMEQHYAEHISLSGLAEYSGLSKSTLLRSFIKSKGITPYRYLQAIRINKAKELLEKDISPLETAMLAGFSDQSHFSKFFNMFIGLSPATYRNIFRENRKDNNNGK